MNIHSTILATLLTTLAQLPVAAQAERPAPQRAGHALSLAYDGAMLRVSGGQALDPCAIMIGMRETSWVLPGNALLSIVPMFLLPTGQFDDDGVYEFVLPAGHEGVLRELNVFAQAIAVQQETGGLFVTSNVALLAAAGQEKASSSSQDLDPVPTEESHGIPTGRAAKRNETDEYEIAPVEREGER